MVQSYSLVREAEAIATGISDMPPRRAHLRALLQLIEALKTAHQERLDVIGVLVEERRQMVHH
jgi:hypothetical protein